MPLKEIQTHPQFAHQLLLVALHQLLSSGEEPSLVHEFGVANSALSGSLVWRERVLACSSLLNNFQLSCGLQTQTVVYLACYTAHSDSVSLFSRGCLPASSPSPVSTINWSPCFPLPAENFSANPDIVRKISGNVRSAIRHAWMEFWEHEPRRKHGAPVVCTFFFSAAGWGNFLKPSTVIHIRSGQQLLHSRDLMKEQVVKWRNLWTKWLTNLGTDNTTNGRWIVQKVGVRRNYVDRRWI